VKIVKERFMLKKIVPEKRCSVLLSAWIRIQIKQNKNWNNQKQANVYIGVHHYQR
jgi:hypothetical protein